jgi:uncharacterized repeat protein (TIGR03803 family)
MHSRLSFSRKSLAGGLVVAAWFVTGQAAHGQSFDLIYSFPGYPEGGQGPLAGLTYANGTFYGTTPQGEGPRQVDQDNGTVFSLVGNAVQVISSFGRAPDGKTPTGGLIEVGGLLYGTTADGGHHQHGTVFQISPSGSEKVLYAFHAGAEGGGPVSSLVAKNGRFYGTTSGDGSGYGTVFFVTPSGRYRLLHAFTGGSDGANPTAGLTDIGGTLYGTTSAGGSGNCTGGCGTVFKLVPSGIQVVYAFQGGSDGAAPEAAVVGIDGTIFGTTSAGGKDNCSQGSSLPGCGTVFKLTPAGAKTIIHNFGGGDDGYLGGSLTAVGHVLYGTTVAGGGGTFCHIGCGTVFKMTEHGQETVLHAFQGSDGAYPAYGAKLLYVSGSLYGTTKDGGSAYFGAVFSVTP